MHITLTKEQTEQVTATGNPKILLTWEQIQELLADEDIRARAADLFHRAHACHAEWRAAKARSPELHKKWDRAHKAHLVALTRVKAILSVSRK